jgi:hypothetical protein
MCACKKKSRIFVVQVLLRNRINAISLLRNAERTLKYSFSVMIGLRFAFAVGKTRFDVLRKSAADFSWDNSATVTTSDTSSGLHTVCSERVSDFFSSKEG